jgi:hypothetical protein
MKWVIVERRTGYIVTGYPTRREAYEQRKLNYTGPEYRVEKQ